jgi:hypothetical protein
MVPLATACVDVKGARPIPTDHPYAPATAHQLMRLFYTSRTTAPCLMLRAEEQQNIPVTADHAQSWRKDASGVETRPSVGSSSSRGVALHSSPTSNLDLDRPILVPLPISIVYPFRSSTHLDPPPILILDPTTPILDPTPPILDPQASNAEPRAAEYSLSVWRVINTLHPYVLSILRSPFLLPSLTPP